MKKTESFSTTNIKHHRNIVVLMVLCPLVVMGLVVSIFYVTNTKNNGVNAATGLAPLPPQPAGFFYNSEPSSAWAKPGALVICGRDNCGGQGFKNVSAAGGTVLVYLDTIVNVKAGRYHDPMLNQSACGPAIGTWPGSGRFNSWGYVNDVRVGGALQQKLPCVLETIIRENPHIGGFFADDLGGDNGHTQAGLPKEEDYQAAVALSRTFRSVADKYKLMFVPNGGWEGGHGAGYPTRTTSGNALADGVCVEHHSTGELNYWRGYLTSSQWASQSSLTHGTPFHIIITYPADFSAYRNANFNGFIANQSDYANAGTPWSGFHATGLPNKVNGSTGTGGTTPPPPTPSPTPPPPSPTAQTPYTAAVAIPGRLEAENYDKGGEGTAYHDGETANLGGKYRTDGVDIENSNEGGYSVGWVNSGEWLEYTTSITQSGSYDVTFRVATANTSTSTWRLKKGSTVLATVSTTSTGGWYSWKDIIVKGVALSSGTTVLRLEASGQALNLNYLSFAKSYSSAPAPIPPPPPAPSQSLPPVKVPDANTTDPVAIPNSIPIEQDGTIIADFNGDGLNDVVKDSNQDGQIDPLNEIVIDGATNQGLTDSSQPPIFPEDYDRLINGGSFGEFTGQDSSTVTVKPGPLPEVKIPKPVAYTFLTAGGLTLTGIGTYLALTKLALFAGFRGKLGL